MSAGATADWSEVDKGVRKLLAGLDDGMKAVTRQAAAQTADSLRSNVPVRTGALVGTVGVTDDGEGAAVTYGGDLPYARYIEGRTHAVADAADRAPDDFQREAIKMAKQEIHQL